MILIAEGAKILIYNENVDMRKSIDGLVNIIVEQINLDPQSKCVFLFYNKSADKIKAIYWEGDGFSLLYKRLEAGKFKFPKHLDVKHYEIDGDLFSWLRKGFDFFKLKYHPELKISKYF